MDYLGKRLPARVGLYTVGLQTYWAQFSGLRERLVGYGRFMEGKLREMGAEVFNFGLVDTEYAGAAAGEYFNQHNVDILFCHAGTYATSASLLPLHQRCAAPTVILSLQPAARINYEKTDTGEWLAHCGACPVPELCNALHRSGTEVFTVSGLLGLTETPACSKTEENTANRPEAIRAWGEINEWVKAAALKRTLRESRIGFLGQFYGGMLDMYTDLTLLSAKTGVFVKILEMCDLALQLKSVTPAETARKLSELYEYFTLPEPSPSEPLAKKPTPEQMEFSARVAAAQERLVKEMGLDGLAYYYHGSPGGEYEALQAGFIAGHSLLTAKGVPCAGEGDIKTCLAMKMCELLGVGGSFCEIVVTDYLSGTILLGHDGPFHPAIAQGKPFLRGMGLYHGKQGAGISVEAKVRPGPITTVSLRQDNAGGLALLCSEAEAVGGDIMQIGNTQTPVRFRLPPDLYMEQWFALRPTHHFAMSVGHNNSQFKKAALLLGMPLVTV